MAERGPEGSGPSRRDHRDAPAVFAKYGITSPLLISHVMAQISHECGAGHDVVENMNYSAPDDRGLAQAVPDHRRGASPMPATRARQTRSTTGAWATSWLGRRVQFPWPRRISMRPAGKAIRGWPRPPGSICRQPSRTADRPEALPRMLGVDFINCGCLPYAKADDVDNVTKRLNGGHCRAHRA
jgi:putative chitinase